MDWNWYVWHFDSAVVYNWLGKWYVDWYLICVCWDFESAMIAYLGYMDWFYVDWFYRFDWFYVVDWFYYRVVYNWLVDWYVDWLLI